MTIPSKIKDQYWKTENECWQLVNVIKARKLKNLTIKNMRESGGFETAADFPGIVGRFSRNGADPTLWKLILLCKGSPHAYALFLKED